MEVGQENGENQLDRETYLSSFYFNPAHSASFSSPARLYKFVKQDGKYRMTRKEINDWLSKQDAYTLHKPAQINFKRPKFLSFRPEFAWDSDTANMTKFSEHNNGYKYFAVFIDIFTRYLYTVPLKTLQGVEMSKAISKVISEDDRKPVHLRNDGGGEYVNLEVRKVLNDHQINQIVTKTEKKANYAERVIKNIKLKISKYMTHNETYKWIDTLSKFTDSYNHSYHRSIKMTPSQARKETRYKVWQNQFNPQNQREFQQYKKYRFKLGDRVKVSYLRQAFSREYSEKWSTEIFTIADRKKNQGIPMYQLKDYDNDLIEGYFYEPELQKAYIGDEVVYKVEKVIKTRKRKGRTEVLVKWKGWPDKFNSWINKKELSTLNQTPNHRIIYPSIH